MTGRSDKNYRKQIEINKWLRIDKLRILHCLDWCISFGIIDP